MTEPQVTQAVKRLRRREAISRATGSMIHVDIAIVLAELDRLKVTNQRLAMALDDFTRDATRWQHCLKRGFPVRNQSPSDASKVWIAFAFVGAPAVRECFGDSPEAAIDAAMFAENGDSD